MIRSLIVRHEAEIDLAAARDWYEKKVPRLGSALLDEVNQTLTTVLDRPESFPRVYRTTRRALTDRFPYAIYFVLLDDAIVVVAILHGSQDRDRALRRRL